MPPCLVLVLVLEFLIKKVHTDSLLLLQAVLLLTCLQFLASSKKETLGRSVESIR